jgi:drug/metabolite transporter (DMT)-like permease
MKLSHAQAVVLLVTATLMWSIAGVVTRQLSHAAGFEITFWRSLFAAATLICLFPIWQGWKFFSEIQWTSPSLWLSSVCWSVMYTAFMIALTLTTVANVLITMSLGPLLTALLSRVVIGQPLAVRTWSAIVVAGVGIGYMFFSQIQLGGSHVAGMLVALLVPVAGAVQWTMTQKLQGTSRPLDLMPAVLLGALLSILIAAPLAWPFSATAVDLGWLALLGVVQLAIPCVLAMLCAQILKAVELTLLALLEVLFGTTWAWLGAREVPDPAALTGGSLVLGALLAHEWLRSRRRAAAPAPRRTQ